MRDNLMEETAWDTERAVATPMVAALSRHHALWVQFSCAPLQRAATARSPRHDGIQWNSTNQSRTLIGSAMRNARYAATCEHTLAPPVSRLLGCRITLPVGRDDN